MLRMLLRFPKGIFDGAHHQLPPVEPLTPLGMNLIGIFLGVLYGWVCIEIVWPSLAGLLALSLAGCGSSDGAGSSAPQKINSSSSESSSVQTAEDPWGLTLSVKDVTPTGLTLVIAQQGGSPTGTLQYGSEYTLEVEQDGAWQNVPDIVDGNFAWLPQVCHT